MLAQSRLCSLEKPCHQSQKTWIPIPTEFQLVFAVEFARKPALCLLQIILAAAIIQLRVTSIMFFL